MVVINKFQVIKETAKAVLLSIPRGYCGFQQREVWIPKSQISTRPNTNPCFVDDKIIPAWLARKLDLI